MTSVAVIQARTNSTRLPGKVLLPVGGRPVVVLAAQRAANTGRNAIVATSTEKSDDGLVEVLRGYGIRYYRGSLEDTLSRFVEALKDFDDETLVFRLTADNVLPDGHLLDEIEDDFYSRGLEYLACNGMNSGLPYGMSAEVMRLRLLRLAHRDSSVLSDLEHVTPYIIRKFGKTYFQKYFYKGMGHYRCTIDCLDDYLYIEKLFREINNPVDIHALDLIDQMKGSDLQPLVSKPACKLVLGAAQLGMHYGISNTSGQPGAETGKQLIRTAIVNGVRWLDTARAYGSSEEIIGRSLSNGWQGRVQIVTKMSTLTDCPDDAPPSVVDAFVDSSLYNSLTNLGTRKIDTLLLHRTSHLRDWNGSVWNRLVKHTDEGRIDKLGISVQCPHELLIALDESRVSHIQMPFSIIDHRWDELSSHIEFVKATRDLTIHVRSVLLQGLLCSHDIRSWNRAHVENPTLIWKWLEEMREGFERTSLADLCIGFVAGFPWIDGIVVGTETMGQLMTNLALMENDPLSYSQIQEVRDTRPWIENLTLNPALWKRADR
ncbi:MAG: aldo/keto reductase [Sphingomonadaceae bacterium]